MVGLLLLDIVELRLAASGSMRSVRQRRPTAAAAEPVAMRETK